MGVDVVDEAAHAVAVGEEGGAADAQDRLAHVGVDVAEGLDREGGATPVASCSSARKPSSVSVCMPQSVWWISITSRVPSRRWETASERITSSVMTPPALRSTCASPSPRPSAAKTSSRESMQVTIARRRLGCTSRCLSGSELGEGPVVGEQLVDRVHRGPA